MSTDASRVTPALDDFLRDFEQDDNHWWVASCGDHVNLFEEAVDRMRAEEARIAAALDTLARWEERGHKPECPQGSGPCERCAKASGASVLRRILTQ